MAVAATANCIAKVAEQIFFHRLITITLHRRRLLNIQLTSFASSISISHLHPYLSMKSHSSDGDTHITKISCSKRAKNTTGACRTPMTTNGQNDRINHHQRVSAGRTEIVVRPESLSEHAVSVHALFLSSVNNSFLFFEI